MFSRSAHSLLTRSLHAPHQRRVSSYIMLRLIYVHIAPHGRRARRMARSHQDFLAAQIEVREATQSLLAAEKRYHAAIACPVHRLIYDPAREDSANPMRS